MLLLALAVLALVIHLAYRWVLRHPERVKRWFDRIGGRHVYAFLESPAGLWLARRFSPNGIYGLVLTLGLVLTGLFSWAFGGVQEVVARDPLVRTDRAVVRYFHAHGEPYLTTCVGVFEAVFAPSVLLPVTAIAGFALLPLARRRGDFETGLSGIVFLATVAGTGPSRSSSSCCFTGRGRPPRFNSCPRRASAFRALTPWWRSPSGRPSGTSSGSVLWDAGASRGRKGRGSRSSSWRWRCLWGWGACTRGRATRATC